MPKAQAVEPWRVLGQRRQEDTTACTGPAFRTLAVVAHIERPLNSPMNAISEPLPSTKTVHLDSAQGVGLCVSPFGAQVLGWQSAGREQLFLSPYATLDGSAPIRGGVPVCFPQFNLRPVGAHRLPKHGFARNLVWQLADQGSDGEGVFTRFTLKSSEATRAMWPYEFEASMHARADLFALRVTLEVRNTGSESFDFAAALHTYLKVSDAASPGVQVHGLQGAAYWDAVAHPQDAGHRSQDAAPLRFGAETDRVYPKAPREVRLYDGPQCLTVRASETLPDTVIWNPGRELCAKLPDMAEDGWRKMLCIEAAAIETPVPLVPGQLWRGWQELVLA